MISPEALRTVEGLKWLATEQHDVEAKSAWRAIVPVGACAFERIAETDDPDETQRIAIAAWLKALDTSDLIASSPELLLSLGGYAGGGSWERVLVSDARALLTLPEPEFIAMNIEKTRFIAITTEEHELLLFYGVREGAHWRLCAS